MKLNLNNLLGHTRRPDISFFASGKIEITSRVAKALGIAPADVIDIMTDDDEYYLFIAARAATVRGRHEAQCRPTNRGGRHFRAYSRRLCSAILKAAGSTFRACLAAGDPVEINGRKAIPIITRKNYNS